MRKVILILSLIIQANAFGAVSFSSKAKDQIDEIQLTAKGVSLIRNAILSNGAQVTKGHGQNICDAEVTDFSFSRREGHTLVFFYRSEQVDKDNYWCRNWAHECELRLTKVSEESYDATVNCYADRL